MVKFSKGVVNSLATCMLILVVAFKSQAQEIPNGDFEEWLTCLCDPPNWVTSNIYPPPLECRQVFMDYLTPYSGNYCVEGKVDTCPELALLRPPLIQSFEIPLESKSKALHGYYKFIPVGSDLFNGNIKLYENNVLIGEGKYISEKFVSSFTEFILNIEYSSSDTPDVAIIRSTIDSSLVSNKLHQGSKWYIDHPAFGPLSDVDDEQIEIPNTFYLYQNYPNPFNSSTKIKYSVPQQSNIVIKVFDVLSNEIEILVSEEKPAGIFEVIWNAANMPSGFYFYRLQAGSFIQTRKMILLK
jgi:hypothetical protein